MKAVTSRVVLLPGQENREHLVANMARLCYADDEKLKKMFRKNKINEVDDAKLIRMLADMRHWSPFEHASYTFKIEGVSRILTHQLVRQRTGKFSQRSQRYVGHNEFDFIVPPNIIRAGLEERYREMMRIEGDFYEELSNGLERELGITGESVSEDVRYVLPGACETKIGITFDAHNFLNFLNKRLCGRAQWEIRRIAEQMLALARPTAPNIFRYAGPDCYTEGRCHEGKKTCGKAKEMRELYEGESI